MSEPKSILPEEILVNAGAKVGDSFQWLGRNSLLTCQDDDWETPLGVVKIISDNDKLGLSIGIWFGISEVPYVVLWSGVGYGCLLRPIAQFGHNVTEQVVPILTRPGLIRNLLTKSDWMGKNDLTFPDISRNDLNFEFLRSPITLRQRFGVNDFSDAMYRHEEMLKVLSNSKSFISGIFQGKDDVRNARCWIELATCMSGGSVYSKYLYTVLETAYFVNSFYKAAPMGYPESVLHNKNFLKTNLSRFNEFLDFPEKSILELKLANLEGLSERVINDMKANDPEIYSRVVNSGIPI
jgi:hypothetical protein